MTLVQFLLGYILLSEESCNSTLQKSTYMKMDVALISIGGLENKKSWFSVPRQQQFVWGFTSKWSSAKRLLSCREGALCQLGCRYEPTGTQKDDWVSSSYSISFTSIIIYVATQSSIHFKSKMLLMCCIGTNEHKLPWVFTMANWNSAQGYCYCQTFSFWVMSKCNTHFLQIDNSQVYYPWNQ